MTPEDWKFAEDRIMSAHFVELVCDGYRVSLFLMRRKMRLFIVPYINGKLNHGWCFEDCEERRRFMRPCSRPLHTPKDLEFYRSLSKSTRKRMGFDPKKKFYYWQPQWPSFASLKRHLIANNKSITLIREDA